IRCLRTEYDRGAFRAAEDLVEQRQFHLPEPWPAEMRPEVSGPQAALLDDLLQRRDERLTDGVVEVVRLPDDEIDRFTLRALQLLGPLRVGGEVPRHRSSFLRSPNVSIVAVSSRTFPQQSQQLFSHYYSAARRLSRAVRRQRRRRVRARTGFRGCGRRAAPGR